MRIKHRYLLFRLRTDDSGLQIESLNQHALVAKFKESIAFLHGDYAGGSVHLVIKYFNPYTATGILRVPRDALSMVWSSLTLMTKINSKPCVVDVLHVSGKASFVSY